MNIKRILVVDDDQALSEALGIILTSEGYSVDFLCDGPCVYEHLNGYKPDLIILDYRLPSEDGVSVARRIKSQTATSTIPIVMVSASLNVSSSCKDAGIEWFIPKPFDVDELLITISRVLAS